MKLNGGQLPKGIDQNDPSLSTAERIAGQHHVSPATVKIKEERPDLAEKIKAGERYSNTAALACIGR